MKNHSLANKVNKARTFRGYKIRFGRPTEADGRYCLAGGEMVKPSTLPHCVTVNGQTIRVTLV